MIKKIIISILTLTLSISIVACSNNIDSKEVAEEATEEVTENRGDDSTLDLRYYYNTNTDDEETKIANDIIGKDILDINMTDTMGNKVKLSDYKGKKVILQFAESTCSPCVDSIPIMKDLEKSYSNIVFLKYYMLDSKESLEYTYKKQNLKPSIYSFTGRDSINKDTNIEDIKNYYKTDYFPSYYFINKDGKISLFLLGGVSESDLKNAIDNFAFKTKFLKK